MGRVESGVDLLGLPIGRNVSWERVRVSERAAPEKVFRTERGQKRCEKATLLQLPRMDSTAVTNEHRM
jgi:hypothetical protein